MLLFQFAYLAWSSNVKVSFDLWNKEGQINILLLSICLKYYTCANNGRPRFVATPLRIFYQNFESTSSIGTDTLIGTTYVIIFVLKLRSIFCHLMTLPYIKLPKLFRDHTFFMKAFFSPFLKPSTHIISKIRPKIAYLCT